MKPALLIAFAAVFLLRVLAGEWFRRDKRLGGELVASSVVLLNALVVVVLGWVAASALENPDAFNIGVAAVCIFIALFELVKAGGMLFILVARREGCATKA